MWKKWWTCKQCQGKNVLDIPISHSSNTLHRCFSYSHCKKLIKGPDLINEKPFQSNENILYTSFFFHTQTQIFVVLYEGSCSFNMYQLSCVSSLFSLSYLSLSMKESRLTPSRDMIYLTYRVDTLPIKDSQLTTSTTNYLWIFVDVFNEWLKQTKKFRKKINLLISSRCFDSNSLTFCLIEIFWINL